MCRFAICLIALVGFTLPFSSAQETQKKKKGKKTVESAQGLRWDDRVRGKILDDFPVEADDGEVALVLEKGKLGYVWVDDLRRIPKTPLYSLGPFPEAQALRYFSPPPTGPKIGLGRIGENYFRVIPNTGRDIRQAVVSLSPDGSLLLPNSSPNSLKLGEFRAVLPENVTDGSALGGQASGLPFFALSYNTSTKKLEAVTSMGAIPRASVPDGMGVVGRPVLRNQGRTLADRNQYSFLLGGTLIVDIAPDGAVVYRQDYSVYPTYLDWPKPFYRGPAQNGTALPPPYRCAPGIVSALQLFDTDWVFDEELRAFVFKKGKTVPVTRSLLRRMSKDDSDFMVRWVDDLEAKEAEQRRGSGLPPVRPVRWQELDDQEKLEVFKSYVHTSQHRQASGRMAIKILAGFAIGYYGPQVLAGAASAAANPPRTKPTSKPNPTTIPKGAIKGVAFFPNGAPFANRTLRFKGVVPLDPSGGYEEVITDNLGSYQLKSMTTLYEVSFPGTPYPTQTLGRVTTSPANILVKTK